VVVIGLQMVMYGTMRVAPYTHYFTGACGVYILLAWFAADAAGRWRGLGVPLFVSYSLALGVLTACGMVDVHRAGGNRNHFGPSLAGQIEIARAIQEQQQRVPGGAISIVSELPQYREHVHGLYTLRRLLDIAGPTVADAGGGTQIDIGYRSDDGWDAHLKCHVRNPQDSVNR